MQDVQERFEQLRQSQEALNLYALVDGLQFEKHTGERLQRMSAGARALLDGTEDEPLAHAGPWLIDAGRCPDQLPALAELEHALPAVSWLITAIDLDGLAQVLQLMLDIELPTGKKALLRFYDPRVLGNLYYVMTPAQRAQFFYLVDEWLFIYNGQRVRAGRSGV